MHCDLQHHNNAIKAKMTPMPRQSKRKLAGRSNQIKRARISVERELEARALLPVQSKEPGPHSESEEESDLEVSDSENESDMKFNQ